MAPTASDLPSLVAYVSYHGARVEEIDAARIAPAIRRAHAPHHRGQESRAFDHRGVDDLAAARCARLEQRARNPNASSMPPPPKVADEVERRHGPAGCVPIACSTPDSAM
jgi:hypothetical protein